MKLQARGLRLEFCKVFKNIFFTEHLWTTASIDTKSSIYVLTITVRMVNVPLINHKSAASFVSTLIYIIHVALPGMLLS